MSLVLLFASIFSLLFVGSDCSNDTNTSFDCTLDWTVDFVGKSGQFKLYPCSDDNFFIKIKLQRVQAYDEDGSKQNQNKQSSFSYASAESAEYSVGVDNTSDSIYTWEDENGDSIDLEGVRLYYEWEISDTDVTFLMNVYLIDEDVTVSYVDSENVTHSETIAAGSVKFDYTIENWPFENDDDMLEIEMKMTTGGTTSSGEDGGSSNDMSTFAWSDEFGIVLPETYENRKENGTARSRDANITYDASSSGNQVDVSILFIDAGDAATIMYDPWVSGFSESSAQMVKFGSGYWVSLIVLILAYNYQ